MHVWSQEAQFNGRPEALRKMTRVHQRNVRDKLCDREDYVEDQEIKLENKEEQLNQLKETGS